MQKIPAYLRSPLNFSLRLCLRSNKNGQKVYILITSQYLCSSYTGLRHQIVQISSEEKRSMCVSGGSQ